MIETTKYETIWGASDGRRLCLEEMDTNHLLNCYKHTLNNYLFYMGAFYAHCHDQKEACKEVDKMRNEFKQELLSRGVSSVTIESWIEDTSLIKRN